MEMQVALLHGALNGERQQRQALQEKFEEFVQNANRTVGNVLEMMEVVSQRMTLVGERLGNLHARGEEWARTVAPRPPPAQAFGGRAHRLGELEPYKVNFFVKVQGRTKSWLKHVTMSSKDCVDELVQWIFYNVTDMEWGWDRVRVMVGKHELHVGTLLEDYGLNPAPGHNTVFISQRLRGGMDSAAASRRSMQRWADMESDDEADLLWPSLAPIAEPVVEEPAVEEPEAQEDVVGIWVDQHHVWVGPDAVVPTLCQLFYLVGVRQVVCDGVAYFYSEVMDDTTPIMMQVIEGTLKRLKELNKPFKYIGKRNLANAHASGP
jgi:hypothetical protein